ncbi:hypothetical protein HOF56_02335 [Candidatus Peribacteria bacterium]|jgi:hypothetical protein|nr:hypothetical protein [Candidatus Peribacteria bacterium]MBT4021051.1 hypothetical protein [Candidatus Peribacteria bacterium]MBT4240772.1 hypothetical protein [Candidatus Peribacteria bacterium]MBT4474199.1 hypothetical protein [Candidatus Peribacteria bacterium]
MTDHSTPEVLSEGNDFVSGAAEAAKNVLNTARMGLGELVSGIVGDVVGTDKSSEFAPTQIASAANGKDVNLEKVAKFTRDNVDYEGLAQ